MEGVNSLVSIFADDTKQIGEINSAKDAQAFQTEIDKLHKWASDNQMKFNEGKCSVMHFGTKNICHNYNINGVNIKTSTSEKDIGVVVQNNLKFDQQCRKVAQKSLSLSFSLLRDSQMRKIVFTRKSAKSALLNIAKFQEHFLPKNSYLWM